MPPDAQEINSLRNVVRPHLNREVTEILACDIEAACKYLEQRGGTATTPFTRQTRYQPSADRIFALSR
jgi:glutamate decarboxylase